MLTLGKFHVLNNHTTFETGNNYNVFPTFTAFWICGLKIPEQWPTLIADSSVHSIFALAKFTWW